MNNVNTAYAEERLIGGCASKPALGRPFVYKLLEYISEGRLELQEDGLPSTSFGEAISTGARRSLIAKLIIHRRAAFKKIANSGSLGFGESYLDGDWEEAGNNLVDLIGLLMLNRVYAHSRRNPLHLIRFYLQQLLRSPIALLNSRRNVAHHYDLGNDFYSQMLDESMTYSCGYQLNPDDSLNAMQRQKYELICRKLNLQADERIVDVGCGWGGMLIYAAQNYGVRGVGITLSHAQHRYATALACKLGLSGQIEFRLEDYRNLSGQFDKFVSIGMFEHVGAHSFSTYMRKVESLLKDGGVGLLHTIGTTSRVRIDPWINRYIFPGGYLPHLAEVTQHLVRQGLNVAHSENLRPHYAETLKKWRQNLLKNKQTILGLSQSYNERLIRMYNFYLQSFEAGFRYGQLQLYQVLFYRGQHWNMPTTLNFDLREKALTTREQAA